MKLGMISPSHDAAGIQRIKALGLDYAEFDVNADDISYLNRAEIRKALSETGVKLGAVGRWGRDRITADGSICAKEQKDEFDLIDMCAELGCPVYITGCQLCRRAELLSERQRRPRLLSVAHRLCGRPREALRLQLLVEQLRQQAA